MTSIEKDKADLEARVKELEDKIASDKRESRQLLDRIVRLESDVRSLSQSLQQATMGAAIRRG